MVFLASGRSQVAGPRIPHLDKVTHFAVYGLLATLVLRALPAGRRAWLAVALVSLFGISDEWHQSFTPGRSVEFADWLADTLGAALAVTLYVRWTWYRRLLETRLSWSRRVETAPVLAPNSAT
ncbi:MAG: VanZ family protein [Opitutae bacterium]|nr:VanZ family protein [Opitutae bacterium]